MKKRDSSIVIPWFFSRAPWRLACAGSKGLTRNSKGRSTGVLITIELVLVLYAVAIGPSWVWADIYKYIDSNGVVHFTNTPTGSGYVFYLKEGGHKKKAGLGPSTYDAIIQKAQEKYGISSFLIKAVIQAESGFDPDAVSRKGAKGLMQIMPSNYKFLSISDPFDPSQNIMGGAKYLKRLLIRYDQQLPLALAAYNAGPTAVDRFRKIPPYKETQDYVRKVMELYSLYRKI